MSETSASLRILWLDDDMVAVHKPAGWLVHRTGLDAHETRFVMQTLRDQLGRHVFPVHRLDKGTSGVLIMALHSEAARALCEAFETHRVHKHYLAMVRGWPALSAHIDHALKPDDAPADALAQPAVTDFRRLATLQLDVPVDRYPSTRVALMQAWPHTGRRHQIRRHLKHMAHPIIGDATHGKGAHNRWWAQQLGQQRLWLHALSLNLVQPLTGQRLKLVSPLPAMADQHQTIATGGDVRQATLNQDWGQLLADYPWQFDRPLNQVMSDDGLTSA
ncbi:MAG: pseudouridine synthase [Aquabacterium sp.]|uniref:pseudouridine synthase n=1 Tax=Aquabacterium sp. TaxID=1872578 RepID=UPI0011FD763F|nr:pseudouridine synthase [Aquabacterium sp.]TAK93930.1 MAG: pseudouridine synthase [Aquabacterium sp.]